AYCRGPKREPRRGPAVRRERGEDWTSGDGDSDGRQEPHNDLAALNAASDGEQSAWLMRRRFRHKSQLQGASAGDRSSAAGRLPKRAAATRSPLQAGGRTSQGPEGESPNQKRARQ